MQKKLTWFDLNYRTDSESRISCCLLRLFDLIKESLHIYFNIKNSKDIMIFCPRLKDKARITFLLNGL